MSVEEDKNCSQYPKLFDEYKQPKRLLAIGDLHGDLFATLLALEEMKCIQIKNKIEWTWIIQQYGMCLGMAQQNLNTNLSKILRTSTIPEFDWIADDTILVQTGDQIHRGRCIEDSCILQIPCDKDADMMMLQLFTLLNKKARERNSIVISLVGNHELEQITKKTDSSVSKEGLLRYATEEEKILIEQGTTSSLITQILMDRRNDDYSQLSVRKMIGCTRLAIVKIGEYVFVHGGIPPYILEMLGEDRNETFNLIEELNNILKQWMFLPDFESNSSIHPAGKIAIGNLVSNRKYGMMNGDLQKKTNYTDPKCAMPWFKFHKMIIGHTVQPHINSACDGNVWRIDASFSSAFLGLVPNRNLQYLEILEGKPPRPIELIETEKQLNMPLLDEEKQKDILYIVHVQDDEEHYQLHTVEQNLSPDEILKKLSISQSLSKMDNKYAKFCVCMFHAILVKYDKTKKSVVFSPIRLSVVQNKEKVPSLVLEKHSLFQRLIPNLNNCNQCRFDVNDNEKNGYEIFYGQINEKNVREGYGILFKFLNNQTIVIEGKWTRNKLKRTYFETQI